jgi:chemotaxis protein methyltransferase CheR
VTSLSDREFRAFQELIHAEAGIWLGPSKKALLLARLSRRLKELELSSFDDYFREVRRDPRERVQMLDYVSTNETRFFREPRQFDFLKEELLPRWSAAAAAGLRPRRIRAWSAGCSTGEEPYSLAMVLLSHFPPEAGWDVEIVATDLSTRVLDRARAGLFSLKGAEDIPPPLLRRFMLRGTGGREGSMKAGPALRSVVRFARLNLHEDAYPPGGFDLILCRNVLIYFDAAGKAGILARLGERLAAGGHLLLGHAESLGRTEGWVSARPNIYTRSLPV